MIPSVYRRVAGGRLGLQTFRPSTARPDHHLLCFPHGGGGAQAFARLAEHLAPTATVTAIDPPGRPRTDKAPLTDLNDLLDLCEEHLPPQLLDGSVLMGQSVGGYAAAALANRLQARGISVRGVVLLAAVPPRFLDPSRPLSGMTDAERFEWCQAMGTLPGGEDGSRALFDVFADAIRADCMAYESSGSLNLGHRAPMLVITGRDDAVCPPQQVKGWTETHPQARIRVVPGGHLVATDCPAALAEHVSNFLRTPAGEQSWRLEEQHLRAPDGSRRILPVLVPTSETGPGRRSLADLEPDALARPLREHGALLARDWDVTAPEHLRTMTGGTLRYVGGNSPRSSLGHGVYTSTEYASDHEISTHNELSYAESSPVRIYFACAVPAASGGQTPLVDGRTLVERVPGSVVERLMTRGVCYQRRLHGSSGLGKSWQQTFETGDRDAVTEFLTASGAEIEWAPDGSLRIAERRAALLTHPITEELIWFNQAEQWHSSSFPPDVRDAVRDESGLGGLPHDAAYGDGSPISDQDVAAIRTAMKGAEVAHTWRRGDMLMVNNLMTLHGRRAFVGDRRVLVAMAGRVKNPPCPA